jgi:hypothetical protein
MKYWFALLSLMLFFSTGLSAEPDVESNKGVISSINLVSQQVVIDGETYQILPSTRHGDVVRWPGGEVHDQLDQLSVNDEVFFGVREGVSKNGVKVLQYIFRVIK